MVLALLIAFVIVAYLFFWRTAPTPVDGSESMAAVATVTMAETFAGTGNFSIFPDESVLTWEGKKPLLPNNYTDTGTVLVKSGTLQATNGLITGGVVVVDLTTIAAIRTGKGSGEDMLSGHLKSADFFDVAKYPTAELTLASSTPASDDTTLQTVSGSLTIKGVSNPVSFPVKVLTQGDGLRATARVSLDRTLWGLRYGSGKFFQNIGDNLIADTFTIEFDVVARPHSL